MNEKIGSHAGLVWEALTERGFKSLKELKKTTKLTEKDLYAAIGWLAREGKLTFEQEQKDVFVALIEKNT
ncbi:MAG: winged helix-turn-helix domain-containing protein [Tannerellaceae bacterium]